MTLVAFYLASKNVTRKKERSLLTIIGVLLAVGAFVSLLSIAEGLYQRIQRELNQRNVDVYVLPRNALPMPAGPIGGLATSTEVVPPKISLELAKGTNVDRAEPVVRFQELYQGRGVVVWALAPTAFDVFLPHLHLSATGRELRDKTDIIVGALLAKELDLAEGQTVTLARKDFQVVGLFTTGSSLDDYFCYIMPEAAREILDREGAHEVWMKLKDPAGREVAAEEINANKVFAADYVARTHEVYLGSANEFINYAWLLQFAVAAIGVLIAMTAAMNTMLMSTYERLKEFATLRAIGASRLVVMTMICTESLILSLAGGACGIVFGVMGSKFLDTAVMTLFKLSFPLAQITLTLILQAFLLSGVVGMIGALIPCFIVYRLDIITGLRQE